MKYGIAIIGPHEEIVGFNALGLKVIAADNAKEASKALVDIARAVTDDSSGQQEKIGIVFVIEAIFREIPQEEYRRISSGALPAILSLPGSGGSTGFGNEKIRRIVEKAVGSDIFGNE